MTFGQSIAHCFRHYTTWRGRASRAEYWWWYLFCVIVQTPFMIWYLINVVTMSLTLAGTSKLTSVDLVGVVATALIPVFVVCLVSLGLLLPSIAVAIRRLHDQDKAGGWFWMTLIPWAGGIIVLVFMLLPGTPGPNRFGDAAATA